MPGKNSKQTSVKTETPVASSEVTKVEETKVEATPAPVASEVKKGGKKVASAPAASEAKKGDKKAVAPAKVETAPAAAASEAKKGGKKAAPAKKVEAAPAPAAASETKKGGKKAAASSEAAPAPVAAASEAKKGGKKATASKTEKAASSEAKKVVKKAAAAVEEEEEIDGEEAGDRRDRRIRSFKVKLPGKEEFEGRFTGLTPYQAANKALSKYFRETDKPKSEITFSICESTRKSKKAVYTYIGRRQKLDTPVTYKIQDGREIVKNFKNSLKKVKKSESATESA